MDTASTDSEKTPTELVRELLLLPGNQKCADCEEKSPDWTAINIGIFLCTRCSSIHRTLGVGISVIKSVRLDPWTIEEYRYLSSKGNEQSNKFWEAQLPPFFIRPDEVVQNPKIREYFIRAKYERKEFVQDAVEVQFVTQGWLQKSSPAKKDKWQERWFVLNDATLSYYKNKTDSYATGVIPISSATASFTDDGKKPGQGIIIRVPGRDYKLWHEDFNTVISWIHSVRQAREQYTSPAKAEPTSERDLANLLLNPTALENPDMDGYMSKQGGSIKTWKKRWFVLKDNYLFYFSDKGDPNPKGIISLKEGSIEECSEEIGKKFAINIKTPDRQYFMCSPSQAEMDAWLRAISKKVGQTWSGAARMSGYYSGLSSRSSIALSSSPHTESALAEESTDN